MPTIAEAVEQAKALMRSGVREIERGPVSRAGVPANTDVRDAFRAFPMPNLQAGPDPIRQGTRNDLVPEYRSIPPTPFPPTNISPVVAAGERVAGVGSVVVSGGGGSSVANVPGTPGSPGTPGASGIPGLPGASGATGAAGPTGPTGPRGPSGLLGLPGQDGEDGEQGPPGPPGPSNISLIVALGG